MCIQTGVTVWKRLSGVVTSVTLTFDRWPRPFAWTLPWSLVIIPENFMMIRWWEHSQRGVTDGQTNNQNSISKIFKKVVFEQLYKYFQEHKLFFHSQYGYRKLHSAQYAALELTDRTMHDIDNRNVSVALYMDMSKAFDSLDPRILIHKLHCYKNIERHTAHTIVSWPNPKQWIIVHTSDLMMIIRQSVNSLNHHKGNG